MARGSLRVSKNGAQHGTAPRDYHQRWCALHHAAVSQDGEKCHKCLRNIHFDAFGSRLKVPLLPFQLHQMAAKALTFQGNSSARLLLRPNEQQPQYPVPSTQ
jgi:hypothetical protein